MTDPYKAAFERSGLKFPSSEEPERPKADEDESEDEDMFKAAFRKAGFEIKD